jgi:hypothetical protein
VDPSGTAAIGGTGMAFSVIVLVSCVIVLAMGLKKVYISFSRPEKVVGWACLVVASSSRLIWWALEMSQMQLGGCILAYRTAAYIFNRLAWMFGALSFMVLLLGWIEGVHSRNAVSRSKVTKIVQVVLYGLMGLLVLMLVILIILAFTICEQSPYEDSCRALYNGHVLFQASIQALLALFFLIYGLLLIIKVLPKPKNDPTDRLRKIATFHILLVMITTFVLYTLRVWTLTYYPSTNDYLPAGVFYTFCYILPESIPPLLHLYMVFGIARHTNSRTVSNLMEEYAMEEKLLDEQKQYQEERRSVEANDL